MRIKMKRFLGILLSFALVLGLMPGMSLTAYADDQKAYADYDVTTTANKEKSGEALTALQVKFNEKSWYIIEDNSTAVNAGTVTLLAAESLGTSKFHDSSNKYSTSTIKTILYNMTASGGSFAGVASAINTVSVKGSDIDDAVDAKLYLLSGDEADRVPINVRKIDESWWLRSPVNTSKVKSVLGNGEFSDDAVVSSESVVRPALQLNLSKVVFDSITNTFSLGTLYPLWVGGTQVTSTEHSGEGWSYDHNTKTLTLNGYRYNGKHNGVSYDGNESLTIVLNGYSYYGEMNGINSRGGALNIVLTGSNAIIPKEQVFGIYVESPITLSGSGSLSIECLNISSCIVSTNGDITIESGTVIAQGQDGLVSPKGDVIIKGGNVTLTGAVNGIIGNNVTISGGNVTASGGNIAVSGSVKNAIAGTGWTDTAGTQGKTDIAINTTTGQKLDQYKKVRFGSATVNSKPAAKNLTYTGSAQELVTAGKAEGGTMQYSLDGTRYSTMIPKGTTAGDYTVYYKAVGDEEHTDSGSSSVKVTIAKAMPTVTAPTAKTLTYTGSAQELVNAGSTNDGTLYYAVTAENTAPADSLYATSIPTKTNAGTYYVWYKVVGNTNYADSESKYVTSVISEQGQVTHVVTFKVVNGAWNDGTAANKTVTLSGNEGSPLRLGENEIPAAGSKPNDGYKAGSWDVVPSTEVEITADTTYTYTYASKDSISKEVTFKVVNGAWDDGTTADRIVTLFGKEGDALKLSENQIPKTGSKPDDGYKTGSWDVVPSTDVEITADTTYTYSYIPKDGISKTVTFKIVNGAWDDGTTADKTVILSGKEGEVLKLTAAQIPAAGKKPKEGFTEGSWDVAPSTETAISADTTYTYTYAGKSQAEQTKVEPKSMNDYVVSDELKNNTQYTSKEIIENALREELNVTTQEQANNYSLFDAVLMVSNDGGQTWERATAENFPEGGITATFGFPTAPDGTQTNGQDYNFELAHLVETTVGSVKAGTIEKPELTVTDKGLSATLMGLSPVVISWEKKSPEPEPTPTPAPTEGKITLNFSQILLYPGREKALKATTIPEGCAVKWSSSDSTVASVTQSGVVTGLRIGMATISATIEVDGTEYSASCLVNVVPETYINTGSGEHTHKYVWNTIEATEDADGELRYQCETCGDIKERVPLTAYNVFNKNTTEKIRNAKKDATVKIETNKWISFHKMVMEALAERPDVTLEISFLDEGYKGKRCTVVIPKGTDTKLLVDKNGFTGFLFLGGKFGMKTN